MGDVCGADQPQECKSQWETGCPYDVSGDRWSHGSHPSGKRRHERGRSQMSLEKSQ
jgi:hypothetical protein